MLPSFWRSIKNIGFKRSGSATIWFEPDRRSVAKVKDYLDEAIIAQGTGGLASLRKKAWLALACGLGATLVGIIAMIVIDQVLRIEMDQRKLYGKPFMVAAILGFGLACWGIYTLIRSVKIQKRLSRNDESARS